MNSSNRLRTNIRQQLMKEKSLIDEQRNKLKYSKENNVELWLTKDCSLYSPVRKLEEEDSIHDRFIIGSDTSLSEVDSFFEDIAEIFKGEIPKPSQNMLAASLMENRVASSQFPYISSQFPISSSCPDELGQNRLKNKDKKIMLDPDTLEAYKKAKHNNVEKKRRYKIDDCIKELGELLPPSYDIDLNNKKGYILEKSVEYVQKLKKEEIRHKEIEARQRELEKVNRQLLLQIQTLQHAITTKNQMEHPPPISYSPINPFPLGSPLLLADHSLEHLSVDSGVELTKGLESTNGINGEFKNMAYDASNNSMDTLVYIPDEDAYRYSFAGNDVGFGNGEDVRRGDENMMVSHEEEVYSGS